MSTTAQRSPNKLGRYSFIFNLWMTVNERKLSSEQKHSAIFVLGDTEENEIVKRGKARDTH
jgi:hypothetical protein